MSADTKPTTGFCDEQTACGADPPAAQDPPRFLDKHELEAIGRRAAAWLKANDGLVKSLPADTVLMIDLATGEHCSAPSDEQAGVEFLSRFGEEPRACFHRVGRSTTVGSGWWARHETP